MDWNAVTAEDLVDALREVDWSTPPRPVPEFFSRFTVPAPTPSGPAASRLGFLWKPVAILAAFMTGFSIAFLNDSLLTVLWALLIALLATVLHASFRTPNLKARLNTFREEFRAVWRNYSEL
ncbi:hypothetical protein ACQ4PT_052273 [Festuca glaucescens]